MTDAPTSEPPLEILMTGPEPGASAPSAAPAGTASRPLVPLAPDVRTVRAERWLFVVHLLILVTFSGLVVYFLSLVWRESDRHAIADSSVPTPASAPAQVPAQAQVPAPSPSPVAERASGASLVPAAQEVSKSFREVIEPAVALLPGAEASTPASSRPEVAPPPPAPPRIVEEAPRPAPAAAAPEPPSAAPEEAEKAPPAPVVRVPPEEEAARKLLDEAAGLRAKNPAQAADRYRKALGLLPGRTELLKDIGDLELSAGAPEEAARAYTEFLSRHPGRPDVLQNLAVLQLHAGRTEEARTTLETAIKAAPSADLYYDLGNVLLKQGEPDRAILAYRRALEYDPKHSEAAFNLALAQERSGRRAEAVMTLARTGSVAPEVLRERARMEAMLGGLEADHAFGMARGSADPDLILAVAAGFRRAGEMEKALALLDRAVELAPEKATVRLDRGAVRHAMGRLSEASADYEEAARLDPALAEAPFNLGVLCDERGQYVAALEHYSAALKANPRFSGAHNNIGALYLKVGQVPRAVECFRRCRELDDSFGPARLNLAWGYLALDSRSQAIEELRHYLKEIPKENQDPEAARVLGELEQVKNISTSPRR